MEGTLKYSDNFMNELFQKIPDPDLVLSFEPEELAIKLLFFIRQRTGEKFHIGNLTNEIGYSDISRGISGYPAERHQEIMLAISEAFAWLVAQGLLIPALDNSSSSDGWKTLSRRAKSFESDADFTAYVDARKLNRDNLHPTIAEGVWLSLMRGEFAEAVFKAMRAVEIAVREASGFEEGDHGVAMIRRAFHKESGPLRDP